MKKSVLFALVLVLLAGLCLVSCAKQEVSIPPATVPKGTTVVNIPMISGSSTEATPEAYPVDAAPAILDIIISYPTDPSSSSYDADMRAFLESRLAGQFTVDALKAQKLSLEQWRAELDSEKYDFMQLSPNEVDILAAWLSK